VMPNKPSYIRGDAHTRPLVVPVWLTADTER